MVRMHTFKGPLLLTLVYFNLNINNHMPSKVCNEITYPVSNFKGSTILEWISNFTHSITDVITYPSFWKSYHEGKSDMNKYKLPRNTNKTWWINSKTNLFLCLLHEIRKLIYNRCHSILSGSRYLHVEKAIQFQVTICCIWYDNNGLWFIVFLVLVTHRFDNCLLRN